MKVHTGNGIMGAKRLLHGALSSPLVAPLWSPLSRDRVAIFALHRFAVPEMSIEGHDPLLLRSALERLRKERYHILSLEDAVRRLRERTGFPASSVVFTVDDGYSDFAERGAPVFAAFDAPVTVFTTIGFLDGTDWHWWDQIDYVIRETHARVLSVPWGSSTLTVRLDGPGSRSPIAMNIAAECTTLSEAARHDFVAALAAAAQVEVPARAPDAFSAMTWSDARRLEGQGVSFGPHTVTHPVLIRTTDADAAWQIEESWKRLRDRVARPLPVFAYPNGDFGAREIELVSRSGLCAAVTTEESYAHTDRFHQPFGPFTIPRFPYPENPERVCLTATGFMRVTAAVRRAFALAG